MTREIERRTFLLSVSAILGANAFSLPAFAAENGYLVRGLKGEYYFFTGSELKAIAHKGKCKVAECVIVSPAKMIAQYSDPEAVVVRNSDLVKFKLTNSKRLAQRIPDRELIAALDTSIKKRQVLGSKIRVKLGEHGFAVGSLSAGSPPPVN